MRIMDTHFKIYYKLKKVFKIIFEKGKTFNDYLD